MNQSNLLTVRVAGVMNRQAVVLHAGRTLPCLLSGRLLRQKDSLAVGDRAEAEVLGGGQYRLTRILPRTSAHSGRVKARSRAGAAHTASTKSTLAARRASPEPRRRTARRRSGGDRRRPLPQRYLSVRHHQALPRPAHRGGPPPPGAVRRPPLLRPGRGPFGRLCGGDLRRASGRRQRQRPLHLPHHRLYEKLPQRPQPPVGRRAPLPR